MFWQNLEKLFLTDVVAAFFNLFYVCVCVCVCVCVVLVTRRVEKVFHFHIRSSKHVKIGIN